MRLCGGEAVAQSKPETVRQAIASPSLQKSELANS
jgi:hypothetical protein